MSYWKASRVELRVLLALLVIAAMVESVQIDLLMADWLYRLEGGAWALHANFWTQTVLHDGAKFVIQFLMLALLIVVLGQRARQRALRIRGIEVALIAIAISVSMTAMIKTVSNVSCPWGLLRYGGQQPYIPIFSFGYEGDLGACFPAGHASAGYSLLAFYFLARLSAHRRAWPWLVLAIAVGVVLDIAQQLRGAHFLSHGLWTVIIVWTVNLLVFRWFYAALRPDMGKQNSVAEAG